MKSFKIEYLINFRDPRNPPLKEMEKILEQRNYKARIMSLGNGETWTLYIDKPVDEAAKTELAKIGAELKPW